MPLFGAIVDHTRYRRQVGAFSAFALAIVKGVEVMVGPRTWFFVALLQILSSVLYSIHITATYAYTSELTMDSAKQANYNSHYMAILYVATLVFLVEVLAISASLGADDVGTARVSQSISSLTAGPLFYFAWTHLFRDRPALNQVPPGTDLLTCGFYKVLHTSGRIRNEYRALKWLLVAVMFGEAAMSAISTVATTYMTQVLDMNSTEIGVVFFVVLAAGVPGSKFGGFLAVKLRNPLTSAKICNLFFILVTTAASLTLNGPDDKHKVVVYGILWGLGLGWLSPMHTTAFMSIMPKGSEAELMGNFLVAAQILSWLPSLVFTILNEYGIKMAFGMASLSIYFGLGIMFLVLIGDYEEAIAEGADEVELPQTSLEITAPSRLLPVE
jgi:MFS-type transporter involved in bile tolerance (Atg22 family)